VQTLPGAMAAGTGTGTGTGTGAGAAGTGAGALTTGTGAGTGAEARAAGAGAGIRVGTVMGTGEGTTAVAGTTRPTATVMAIAQQQQLAVPQQPYGGIVFGNANSSFVALSTSPRASSTPAPRNSSGTPGQVRARGGTLLGTKEQRSSGTPFRGAANGQPPPLLLGEASALNPAAMSFLSPATTGPPSRAVALLGVLHSPQYYTPARDQSPDPFHSSPSSGNERPHKRHDTASGRERMTTPSGLPAPFSNPPPIPSPIPSPLLAPFPGLSAPQLPTGFTQSNSQPPGSQPTSLDMSQ
jgi:hypothetical protein